MVSELEGHRFFHATQRRPTTITILIGGSVLWNSLEESAALQFNLPTRAHSLITSPQPMIFPVSSPCVSFEVFSHLVLRASKRHCGLSVCLSHARLWVMTHGHRQGKFIGHTVVMNGVVSPNHSTVKTLQVRTPSENLVLFIEANDSHSRNKFKI